MSEKNDKKTLKQTKERKIFLLNLMITRYGQTKEMKSKSVGNNS